MNSKLREALNQLLGLIDNKILVFADGLELSDISQAQYHIDKAVEAYEEPPRNCDVGTAEEQAERYGRYCDKFTTDSMHCESCPCCGKILLGKCEFAWAQMPYEEGGNNGTL